MALGYMGALVPPVLLDKVVILIPASALVESLEKFVGTYFPFLFEEAQVDWLYLLFGESPQHVSSAATNLWLQSHTLCICNLLWCPLCPVEMLDQQFPFDWMEVLGTIQDLLY